MPFNINLAQNEDALIVAKPAVAPRQPSHFHEFWKGLSFGLGIVLAVLIAFAAYKNVTSFADPAALRASWLAWR